MNTHEALAISSETGDWSIFSLVFIVSFIITWFIGLAPAIIARHALFKAPISRKKANWLAGIWCFLCAITFISINASVGEKSNSGVWIVFVFPVCRWILTREQEKILSPEEQKRQKKSFLLKAGILAIVVIFLLALLGVGATPPDESKKKPLANIHKQTISDITDCSDARKKTCTCAHAGHMICQLTLGEDYAEGKNGVTKNPEKALYWLKQRPMQDNGYGPNGRALELISELEGKQNGSVRKPCDILRLCAFSHYPYLDDNISSVSTIADSIILSCSSESRMCVDSLLLEAKADWDDIQDKEIRDQILKNIQKTWIVPMILAERVRRTDR